MGAGDFAILMDAVSLAKLARLGAWEPGTHFYEATSDSLDKLQGRAVDYMNTTFKNPQGTLEGNFAQIISPGLGSIEGRLENATAYAFRRNYGFSGKTDALGRYYPSDPGINYMEFALDADTTRWIVNRFKQAVSTSLYEIAAGVV